MVFALRLIPAVLIPRTLLWGAALLLALALIIDQWARPLLVAMANAIPVVGGYIADGIEAALGFITDALRAAAGGVQSLVDAWLVGVSVAFDELAGGLAWLAGQTWNALIAVREVAIPGLLSAGLDPLWQGIDAIGARLGLLERETAQGIDALGREQAALRAETAQGIDRVDGRVGALQDYVQGRGIDALPGLIERELPAIEGRVGELERDVPRVADRVDGLAREHAPGWAWSDEFAAAIPAGAAIAAVEAARLARPKLDKLCRLDVADFDDLLELALVIPSLALIVATVRESAEGAGELLASIGEAFR